MDYDDFATRASGYPYTGTQDQQTDWIMDVSDLSDTKK